MWQDDKLYSTERELREQREFERTQAERREERRRNGRKMRVSGASIRRVYRDAVVKRAKR